MPTQNATNYHTWKFFRAGGFDQVRLDSGSDLIALDQLDQKLWVALACPTRGIEFDTKTLDLIDTDKDGRIRAPEIISAAKWAASCLKNPDDLLKCSASLPLSAVNDATPEGKQLLASARQILANLGKPNAAVITPEDTADTAKIFGQTNFNGDGVIPADAAEDGALKTVIGDILACVGAETDRSGKPGVNQAKLDQFFAEARAFSNWWTKAEADAGVLPLGESTSAACATFQAVKTKVDDYFARCRLAAFDARALTALNREEKEYLVLAAKDLTITAAGIAAFPLARIEANRPLPLKEGVNPAWADAVAEFQAEVVKPLLGDRASLTESEWSVIVGKFAAYDGWVAGKSGAAVEKLGLKRVREILANKSKDAINALIARDKALEPEASAVASVDKLVHYHRDLCRLLNNFVCFRDFYSRRDKAIFQAGTLYLDQRSCDLCIRVEDMSKHGIMATLSGIYLAYCDCIRKATGEKMTVAAAFTGGDSDNLMVGRNGIFYDRQGRDWDATIVKILDNPISIRQAFWSPYKKLIRMIGEQLAKRAAAAEAASAAKLQTAAMTAATADQTKPPPAPKKIDVGVVAALGVAVGALGTAAGYFLGIFKGMPIWQVPLVIIGLILIISAPSVVIAWLKLRKRNLGPILDANGWAINAKARINVPFGGSLTAVAKLPPGAQRDLTDPYAEDKSGRNRTIVVAAILALLWVLWYFGAVQKYLPAGFPKSSWQERAEQAAQQKAAEKAAKDAIPQATPMEPGRSK